MSDKKLRCVSVYRLEAGPKVILLAKFDHASDVGGGGDDLYGVKGKDFSKAIGDVIRKDPPSGLTEAGRIGGFKVVEAGQDQLIYGADAAGICYAVIYGRKYPSRVGISGLEEIYKSFSAEFSSKLSSAGEGSLTKKGKKALSEFCKKYETPDVDKTHKLIGEVDAVKAQMQENITGMLANQEQAGALAGKADQLNEQAALFKKRSKALKSHMWWKNMKMTLILGGVVFAILCAVLVPLLVQAKQLASLGIKSPLSANP